METLVLDSRYAMPTLKKPKSCINFHWSAEANKTDFIKKLAMYPQLIGNF